jgi:hypothetical protein
MLNPDPVKMSKCKKAEGIFRDAVADANKKTDKCISITLMGRDVGLDHLLSSSHHLYYSRLDGFVGNIQITIQYNTTNNSFIVRIIFHFYRRLNLD